VIAAPAISYPAGSGAIPAIPVIDIQVLAEKGSLTSYVERSVSITNQSLLNQFGTLSLTWQPAHGDLTVHALEIVRGSERIDVLKSGAKFSILRREQQLEKLSLDGQLTAVMTIPDLRIGDVLRLTMSNTERDKVLAGRVQTALPLVPLPVQLGFGQARLVWPASETLKWKSLLPEVKATPRDIAGGRKELVFPYPVAKLPDLPKNIPARFTPIPFVEATNFTGWQDVAAVMAPLYETNGAIADGSELAKVADGIMAASNDPIVRMSRALQVVQDDVRYQLIALNTGNYEPQSPAQTWQSRFGDCKAKTLLLLALLRRMDITAEPVLANIKLGDLVADRLPSAQAFDHVFVRAEVSGESFWLDGTATGARLADIRDVPRFGHVLPVRAAQTGLLALPTRADARPAFASTIEYDASAGLLMPMPVKFKLSLTGAQAEKMRATGDGDQESLQKWAEEQTNRLVDSTTMLKARAVYDKADATWTMEVEGVSYPSYGFADGNWYVEFGPKIGIDFEPDRSRSAWRQIPATIDNPWTSAANWSLRLPDFAAQAAVEGMEPVSVSIPAVTYSRSAKREGTLIASTENVGETGAEVPPELIGAGTKAVADAKEHKLRVVAPSNYPMPWDEVDQARRSAGLKRIRAIFDQRIADAPKEAVRYADRGWLAEQLYDWQAAEADYGAAIKLDPTVNNYVKRYNIRNTRGDLAGAQSDAQAAFDLNANDEDARNALRNALAQRDQTDAALDLIPDEKDLSTDAGENALVDKADVLFHGKRVQEAIDLLSQGIRKRQSSQSMLNARCWYAGLADLVSETSLNDCTRAIELADKPASYLDSRAMVHFRAGRLEAAKADLDSALAISPTLSGSLFMRGVIAGKLNDKVTASRDLAAAIKLYPGIAAYYAQFGIKP
jgi:tetratricopeptide (TPR) repeat protein